MKTASRKFLNEFRPDEWLREIYPNPQLGDAGPVLGREVQATLWGRLSDAGLLRVSVRGSEATSLEAMIAWLEEAGRMLLPAPYVADVVLGAMTLAAAHGAESARLLSRFEKGELRLTLALDGSWSEPDRLPIKVRVRRNAGMNALSGVVSSILDPQADYFLVPAFDASDERRLSIFLVPRNHPGVVLQDHSIVDRTRPTATLSLRNARISSKQLVGKAGRAERLIEDAIVRCLVALSAEMIGAASRVLAGTLDYARDRRLAGTPIANLQSVAHRLAELHARIELTRPLVHWAARRASRPGSGGRTAASMAKAAAGDLALEAVESGLRIHGARGVTWDHWLHPYHRRALLDRQLFGSPDLHRELIARQLLSTKAPGYPLDFAGEIP